MKLWLSVALLLLAAVAANAATLDVAVRDTAQKPIEGAYVAVIADGGRWNEPVLETVAGPEGQAAFDLLPGRYRIVAGARWHEPDFGNPVELPNGGLRTAVTLARLGSVTGRVQTADGAGIRDARVGMYRDFLADHPHALSERGSSIVRTLVRTDADGWFELPVPLRGSAVIMVEADGMAPAAVDNVRAGGAVAPIVLSRGAALTARGDAAAGARLQLQPVRIAETASLPRHRLAAMWQRAMPSARWSSLPAGTYDVLLLRNGASAPVVLERVTLRPGDRRELALRLVPRTSADTVASPHAELLVRVTAPAGARAPTHGSFEGAACGDGAPVTSDLAIRDGIGIATVPAGCLAGTLRFRGFRSIATGRLEVAAGERRELPAYRLELGRSVMVRVVSPAGDPRPGAIVGAVTRRELATASDVAAVVRLGSARAGTTDGNGWIRIEDLPDEHVVLVATLSDRALPLLSQPLHVFAGEERLETLIVESPATVQATLERSGEAADELIASSAVLRPAHESLWPPGVRLHATFDADLASFAEVPAGSWVLAALVRVPGGSTEVAVGAQRLEIPGGAVVAQSIALASVIYRGRIERGDKPLDAMLALQPEERRDGAQVAKVESGRFSVILERPGRFRGSLQTPDGRRVALPEPIAFASTNEEVVVRVGEGTIAGVVENERGEPAGGARITAKLDGFDGVESQATSRDGTFTIEALSPGRWLVYAWSDGRRSDAVPVTVAGPRTASEVRLRLKPLTKITGRIRHAQGVPAAGALVIVQDLTRPMAASMPARANEAGEFTIQLDAGAAVMANVAVITRDGAASSRRAEIRDGSVIVLADAYGSARVHRKEGWPPGATSTHFLVADDGSWLAVGNAGRIEGPVLSLPRLAQGRWRYVVAEPHHIPVIRSGNGLTLTPSATVQVDGATVQQISLGFNDKEKR